MEHPTDLLYDCARKLAFISDVFGQTSIDSLPMEFSREAQAGLSTILLEQEVMIKKVADFLSDKPLHEMEV